MWDVNLFTSSWDRQVKCFISWKHQPNCVAIDVFSLNWNQFRRYLFQPFCLISRCLAKIWMDEVEVLVFYNVMSHEAWFPLAVELAFDHSRLFPLDEHSGKTPASLTGNFSLNRLVIVREQCVAQDIPPNVCNLLLEGNRSSTYRLGLSWNC